MRTRKGIVSSSRKSWMRPATAAPDAFQLMRTCVNELRCNAPISANRLIRIA